MVEFMMESEEEGRSKASIVTRSDENSVQGSRGRGNQGNDGGGCNGIHLYIETDYN